MLFWPFILRLLTLLGKFSLLIYLNKIWLLEEVGLYTLVISINTFLLWVVTLEYGNYAVREIARSTNNSVRKKTENSLAFFIMSFIFFLPLTYFLSDKYLDFDMVVKFIFILFIDLISQEMYKLLLYFKKQSIAYIGLFIRNGLWCYLLIVYVETTHDPINLNIVLNIWLLFSLMSVVYYIFNFPFEINLLKVNKYFDLTWIRKGIKISIYFTIGMLFYRSIYIVDKVLIAEFLNLKEVAIYGLIISLVGVAHSFIETLIILFFYPMLVDYGASNNFISLNKKTKLMTKSLLFCLVLSFPALYLTMELIIFFTEELAYKEYLSIFYQSFIILTLRALIQIPRYYLYSLGYDKFYISSQLAIGIIFMLSSSFLVVKFGVSGVIYSLMAAYFLGFILIMYGFIKNYKYGY